MINEGQGETLDWKQIYTIHRVATIESHTRSFQYLIINNALFLKGELQRQNKLISFERPFKLLQNETKIIKIGQAVLEIFNFKDPDLDNFTRKNDRKTKNVVFLEVCTN